MRALRLVLLGLAAVIASWLGAVFLMRAFKSPVPQSVAVQPKSLAKPAVNPISIPPRSSASRKADRGAVEASIADAPNYARFFDRLRLAFPSDYETIMDDLAARSAGKAVNVETVMADAVVALRKAHGAQAAKSSDDALIQVYAMQLKDMRALEQSDPHLCVALLYGANVAGFSAFAADHRALVADTAVATLDAMYSGRTDPTQRAAPSDADFKALDRALVAKGLTRPQIDTLLDGTTANPPIPDDEMCRAGQNYLEVLAALPSDVRSRLYGFSVELMAKS